MGLKISTSKTKYTNLSAVETRQRGKNITISENNFEAVKSFVYFGSALNNSNYISQEINRRIMDNNNIYFAHTLIFYSLEQSCY